MRIPDHPTLILRMLQHRLQKLATSSPILAASFAWLTALPVNHKTVEIARKGGRDRWKMENEGFHRQKNSDWNLEHVYSIDPENWKVYYLLLQIAFLLVQLPERGSLLRRLAAETGRPFWKWSAG